MHVPPKRFVRIRHYGLLSMRTKAKQLTLCRNLLGCRKYISELSDISSIEIIKRQWNVDVCTCKSCVGHMLTSRDVYHLRI